MIYLEIILIFCYILYCPYLYVKIAKDNDVKVDGNRDVVIQYLALHEAYDHIKSTNTSAEYAEIMPGIFALLQRYGEARVSPHKAEWVPEISRKKWNNEKDRWELLVHDFINSIGATVRKAREAGFTLKELSDAANVLTKPTIEDIDSQLREAILVGEPQSAIDNLLDKRNEIK